MRSKTLKLAKTELFQRPTVGLSWRERIKVSYDRARAIAHAYDLTIEDILYASPKYWEFHADPICGMDGPATTLLTIHYNLCAGTLAMFARGRPDIVHTLEDLLAFRVSGQFCLTELGHGLDVFNMETTATLMPDGSFELNTPVERAAKFMPPTAPYGIPCVAVVLARVIVESQDVGIKPFLVPLHDGRDMHRGVVCKLLSPRGGSRPLHHSLTYFHHVRLPSSALLGKVSKAADLRAAFFRNISRVIVGTMSMGRIAVTGLRVAAFLAGRYSLRRNVMDASTGVPRPIISFSTQYTPILSTISHALVLEAFFKHSCAIFVHPETNPSMRHFIAAVFKTTVMQHCLSHVLLLGDRCGAQGLFEVNQLSALHTEMRGIAIAEGDTLGISIRFAIEVILGRISLPAHKNPTSLLARHEQSMITDMRQFIVAKDHHDPPTESILLPQCQPLIEAIGHRLAFDAAIEEGVGHYVIELYEASIIQRDPAWYTEHAGISRADQFKMQTDAVTALLPGLENLLNNLDVEQYVTAPIISEERWEAHVATLESFGDIQDCSPTKPPENHDIQSTPSRMRGSLGTKYDEASFRSRL